MGPGHFKFSLNSVPALHLYSGHDTTLVPLLVGLGVYDDEWPPYTADLAFELYEDEEGKHFIKVLFQQKVCKCFIL